MTTYLQIEAAWWEWAWQVTVRRSNAREIVEALGDKPFPFDGTTWTIRLDPEMARNGRVRLYRRVYVGADGRVFGPVGKG